MSELAALLTAYEIGPELGRGSSGVVWQARHRRSWEVVAVKQLSPELTSDPDVRGRFAREARVLSGLDHPHIVAVREVVSDLDAQVCAIVMEHLSGGDLAAVLSRGPMPPTDAVSIGLAICSGLGHAHRRGIVHRDVKPTNVMFGAEAVPKLVDFGLAKVLGGRTSVTATGTMLGTPSFMAPEQVLGEVATPAADVYATGVVLYLMLSGRLPGPAMTASDPIEWLATRVNEDAVPLVAAAPWLPEAIAPVAAVVDRALARRVADRYADGDRLGVALGEAASIAFGSSDGEEQRLAVVPAASAVSVPAPVASATVLDPQAAIGTAVSPTLVASVPLVVCGPDGQARRVEVIGPAVIGRTDGDLVLHDPEVSGRHARLTPHGDGTLRVDDLGSANGTYVDGVRLTGPGRLGPRGWLDVGATRIVLAGAPP